MYSIVVCGADHGGGEVLRPGARHHGRERAGQRNADGGDTSIRPGLLREPGEHLALILARAVRQERRLRAKGRPVAPSVHQRHHEARLAIQVDGREELLVGATVPLIDVHDGRARAGLRRAGGKVEARGEAHAVAHLDERRLVRRGPIGKDES